jgi:hypothetical protein
MHYLTWFSFFGFLLISWFGVQHVGHEPVTTRGLVALAVFIVVAVLFLLLVFHGG